MCKAPVPLASHHRPHRPAKRARATPVRLSASTRHALSVLSATTGRKKSAEARVQLEEKARVDVLMSCRLEDLRALFTAHAGQAPSSCKGSQVSGRRSLQGCTGGGEERGIHSRDGADCAARAGTHLGLVNQNVFMSVISAFASLRELEGLRLQLSSKTCSPATRDGWEG